jgi:hypothetical protein
MSKFAAYYTGLENRNADYSVFTNSPDVRRCNSGQALIHGEPCWCLLIEYRKKTEIPDTWYNVDGILFTFHRMRPSAFNELKASFQVVTGSNDVEDGVDVVNCLCGKPFEKHSLLLSHCRKYHCDESKEIDPMFSAFLLGFEEITQCEDCNKIFMHSGLKIHRRRSHIFIAEEVVDSDDDYDDDYDNDDFDSYVEDVENDIVGVEYLRSSPPTGVFEHTSAVAVVDTSAVAVAVAVAVEYVNANAVDTGGDGIETPVFERITRALETVERIRRYVDGIDVTHSTVAVDDVVTSTVDDVVVTDDAVVAPPSFVQIQRRPVLNDFVSSSDGSDDDSSSDGECIIDPKYFR